MSENYGVFLGNQQVGKVQVLKSGLYYRFICRCALTGDIMCRLHVACGENRENLGLVVPMDGGFGLDKKIPVKRLGEGKMEFCLLPKHSMSSTFVPIYPEEPFGYIEKLKDGFLSMQDGKHGLCLME